MTNPLHQQCVAADSMLGLFRFRSFPLIARNELTTGWEGAAPIVTLTFALPEGHSLGETYGFNLGMGDFLRVRIPLGGKPRSYSPTSDPLRPSSFDLTVKVYPEGYASNFMNNMSVGDSLLVSGPFPPIRSIVKRKPGALVALLAFGVGITEALPIAEAELADSAVREVVLIYPNKGTADAVFGERIAAAQAAPGGERLRVRHVLTREDPPSEDAAAGTAVRGRVSAALLKELLPSWTAEAKSECRYLAVGTKQMKAQAAEYFAELGYNASSHVLLKRTLLSRT